MKKTFINLFCFFAFLVLASNVLLAADKDKISDPFNEEVSIKGGAPFPERERSVIPTCQAFLSSNEVEVLFNKNIGEVSIVIVNRMGTVVSSACCNSEFEFSTYLPKPKGSGVYIIYIMSSKGYQGQGEFSVQ